MARCDFISAIAEMGAHAGVTCALIYAAGRLHAPPSRPVPRQPQPKPEPELAPESRVDFGRESHPKSTQASRPRNACRLSVRNAPPLDTALGRRAWGCGVLGAGVIGKGALPLAQVARWLGAGWTRSGQRPVPGPRRERRSVPTTPVRPEFDLKKTRRRSRELDRRRCHFRSATVDHVADFGEVAGARVGRAVAELQHRVLLGADVLRLPAAGPEAAT
ncbi:hypothetical protein B0I29_103418 [Actinoplanes lutulentus]|uniref:Uncharacterized protein n=1 Tax=Actinoplanes lutulentus TaxID=1287878 RepID=A0A327ZGC2_9ACTN|nr:hypothetical protein B0I29_103418 [Actinoplanes lutulentus]